jgi:ATP sulfurylase
MARRLLLRPWSADDDRKLLTYLAQDKARPVIAALLKRGPTAVAGRIQVLQARTATKTVMGSGTAAPPER